MDHKSPHVDLGCDRAIHFTSQCFFTIAHARVHSYHSRDEKLTKGRNPVLIYNKKKGQHRSMLSRIVFFTAVGINCSEVVRLIYLAYFFYKLSSKIIGQF
jgi:hypothetical protein